MSSRRPSRGSSDPRMYRGFSVPSPRQSVVEDERLSLFAESDILSEGTTLCNSSQSDIKILDMSDSDVGSITLDSDSDSTVSTNFTQSNLPGAGRTLGQLYSKAGRGLEKAMLRVARRAGYGPEASYSRILDMYRDQPGVTDAEAKDLLKHCQRLLHYASSDVHSTKVLAIEKLLELFKCHKLMAFVLTSDNGDLHGRLVDLMQNIDRTAYRTAPESHQRVYNTALLEFSKVEIHRAGVTMLSAKDKEHDTAWKDALERLVAGLRNIESAPLCLWYLSWWPALGIDILFDPGLAFDLCDSLAAVLSDDELIESVDINNLTELSLYMHEYLLHHLDFLAPFRPRESLRKYLAVMGAESLEEYVEYKGFSLRIPVVIDLLNDLGLAYNRRLGQSTLVILHNYHSPELVYERIRRALEEIELTVTVTQVSTLEAIIMKLCVELLDYTSSDLLDEKLFAIEKLSSILSEKDVFAWFLSAGSPDLEASILDLIQKIENLRLVKSLASYSDMLAAAVARFSLMKVHKAGVSLLESRGEKLRLTSNGVKPKWACANKSLTDSSWETPWSDAFKALLEHLTSPRTASLALDYLCFSCWSFQYEERQFHMKPLLENSLSQFNPYLSLDLCNALHTVLTQDDLFRNVYKNNLFWISSRIIRYVLTRLDFLQKFCDGEMSEKVEDFEGARLHIPETIDLLAELGEAHKARAIEPYAHYANPGLYVQLSEMKELVAWRATKSIADIDVIGEAI